MQIVTCLADPGKARGCSPNTFVTDSLIELLSEPLVKIYLRRRHALMVEDGAFSQKIDYFSIFLNFEEHLNRFIGSKVTGILVKGDFN